MAISPQTSAKNAEVRDKHRLTFPVLGDPGNAYAQAVSLAFTLPEDLKAVYLGFGIDLPEFNGDESWTLPVPARIVVDRTGVVRGVDADPDYTLRPEPEDTVGVLKTLA